MNVTFRQANAADAGAIHHLIVENLEAQADTVASARAIAARTGTE